MSRIQKNQEKERDPKTPGVKKLKKTRKIIRKSWKEREEILKGGKVWKDIINGLMLGLGLKKTNKKYNL